MPTFDDANLDELAPPPPGQDETEPEFGQVVHALLDAAASSKRIRTQLLGRKAEAILTDLAATVKRDAKIAEAEAELTRLRRGN